MGASTKGKGKGKGKKKEQVEEEAPVVRATAAPPPPPPAPKTLEQRVQELMADLETSKEENEIENGELTREKLNMRARLGQLNEELQGSQKILEESREEHRFYEDSLSVSLQETQRLLTGYTDCKRQTLNMKGNLAAGREERKQLAKHVTGVRAENQELDQQRQVLFSERLVIRNKLQTGKAEKMAYQLELGGLLKEKQKHLGEIEKLCQSVAVLRSKVAEAQGDKQDACAKVTELRQTKVTLESEIGKMDRERVKAKEQCGIAAHDIKSVQGKIAKIGQENRSLHAGYKRMQEKNKGLKKHVMKAEKTQDEVFSAMNSQEMINCGLQNRIDAAVDKDSMMLQFATEGFGEDPELDGQSRWLGADAVALDLTAEPSVLTEVDGKTTFYNRQAEEEAEKFLDETRLEKDWQKEIGSASDASTEGKKKTKAKSSSSSNRKTAAPSTSGSDSEGSSDSSGG